MPSGPSSEHLAPCLALYASYLAISDGSTEARWALAAICNGSLHIVTMLVDASSLTQQWMPCQHVILSCHLSRDVNKEVPSLADPSSRAIVHPSTQNCQIDPYHLTKKNAEHGKCNPTSLQLLVQQPRIWQVQMRSPHVVH